MKLQRFEARKFYKKQIEEMYSEGIIISNFWTNINNVLCFNSYIHSYYHFLVIKNIIIQVYWAISREKSLLITKSIAYFTIFFFMFKLLNLIFFWCSSVFKCTFSYIHCFLVFSIFKHFSIILLSDSWSWEWLIIFN
jgi:hypothetical protein